MWGLRPIVGAHLAASGRCDICAIYVWHWWHLCVLIWYIAKCDMLPAERNVTYRVRLYLPAWTQELRAEIDKRWYQSSLIHPASIWTDQWNAIYTHLGALISACTWRSRHLSCLSRYTFCQKESCLHTHYSVSLKWINNLFNLIHFTMESPFVTFPAPFDPGQRNILYFL